MRTSHSAHTLFSLSYINPFYSCRYVVQTRSNQTSIEHRRNGGTSPSQERKAHPGRPAARHCGRRAPGHGAPRVNVARPATLHLAALQLSLLLSHEVQWFDVAEWSPSSLPHCRRRPRLSAAILVTPSGWQRAKFSQFTHTHIMHCVSAWSPPSPTTHTLLTHPAAHTDMHARAHTSPVDPG